MMTAYIIFNILFISSFYFVGFVAAKSGNRAADIAALLGVIILFTQIVLFFYPEIEIRIFNFADYAYFRWWGMAGIALIGGTAFEKIRGRDRIALYFFEFIALGACSYLIWQSFFGVSVDFMELGFEDGICRQSTDYTCAPASCVNLLNMLGIKTTEREMTILCATQRLGSAHINIYRGLRIMLEKNGYEVSLTRETPETLSKITVPFITNIYMQGRILHAVTVLKVDKSCVDLAETIRGTVMSVSVAEFLKCWDGLVFQVKKK
jgi:predicted double-glycine peptidase